MNADKPSQLWTPWAWIDSRWRPNVLLTIDSLGRWNTIESSLAPPGGAERLRGALLPGMVNAHSHAFQRGFAGRTERRENAYDDFWSWREQMYALALRLTPDQLEAIATQLYIELLEAGTTQVCEFHYLHHDRTGLPYADPFVMSRALAMAAQKAGIGLTMLPVLYERAGFTDAPLSERQRRFRSTVASVIAMRDAVRRWKLPNLEAGVAIHSLRAATADSISALAHAVDGDTGPIHIHIAEQRAEVRDCVAATGRRPIAWLCQHMPVDTRWHLVHATHADTEDQEAIARTGASVVVCPSTEANLGDGRFDLSGFRKRGIDFSLGTDSHVSRSWPQEIRLLEYSQRLALEQRNIAASPEHGYASSTESIFVQALATGARAAGLGGRWGLQRGARADAVEINLEASGLLGVPSEALLDAMVFACDAPPISQVWVGGRRWVSAGRHRLKDEAARAFIAALQAPSDG